MEKLNKLKSALKGNITKLETYKNSLDTATNINVYELEVKFDKVKNLEMKIERLREDYYGLPSAQNISDIEADLDDCEARLEELQVGLKIQLDILKSNCIDNSSEIYKDEHFTKANVKIPDIPLATFSGKIEDWHSFKIQFSNVIADNNQLNNDQKLYYLRASLKGDAKQIETTDDTFESLFNALSERFENKRLIVETHINALINLEKMSHESFKELRNLLDKLLKHLRALKTLKYENNNLSEILLINIVLQKLDRETRKQFELSVSSTDVPTWNNFVSFLEKRCQILESLNRNVFVKSKVQTEQNYRSKTLMLNTSQKICVACNSNSQHALYKCAAFLNMNSNDRFELVKKSNLCFNCLNYHRLSKCKSKFRCVSCNKPHHTLIHKSKMQENPSHTDSNLALSQVPAITEPTKEKGSEIENEKLVFSTTADCSKKTVLLSTMIVYVSDIKNRPIPARVIADTGSQLNFCSSEFANKLGLKRQLTRVPVCSINGSSFVLKSKVQTSIANETNTYSASLEFLVLPKITDLTPTHFLNIDCSALPPEIKLADPNFFKPGKVDMLIGAEIFFDLLREGKFRMIDDNVILQNTVFGYIISGSVKNNSNTQYCGLSIHIDELENNMRKFWEIESVDEKSQMLTPEEDFCEKHFIDTHYRDEEGRYVVELPLKKNAILGESKIVAEKRLNSLWRRLNADPIMKELYVNFLDEYQKLEHMKEIADDYYEHDCSYYMPHHGVYRPEKKTTPLRVVFNASSPTSNGLSLNDILMNGGFIQDELFAILTRFRTHKFVFSADIQKMYRQILINPKHRDYQRILWKESMESPIKTYQLQTVTYGTTSASFLATRVLKQLALDECSHFPLASTVILSDFYVDDVLSGSNDLCIAKETKRQLIEMLQKCGMTLHKWCSNCEELCEDTDLNCERSFHDFPESATKALGMLWTPKLDTFSFKISLDNCESYENLTKRNVLSYIARIYDPMGLIGPVITKAKIFMQHLWSLKMNWNDTLPPEVINDWKKFVLTLPAIENIQACRYIGCDGEIYLHGFADASSLAYGCVIYLQCVSSTGEISTRLVCSKSRVAPLKTISIPRLELSSCLLLAKLLKKVLPALHMQIEKIFLWTDSTISLAWIQKMPCLLKTFVANRVTIIQELTKECQWSHVSSDSNPADVISRGLYADQLVHNTLWWQGPSFLSEKVEFPNNDSCYSIDSETVLSEMKTSKTSVFTAIRTENSILNTFDKFSNYFKLLRVFSFLFRFIHNSRYPQHKVKGPLTTKEIKDSETFILREIQKGEFLQEINSVKKGLSIPSKSKLKFLNPFICENGLLRVGGRLKNANLNFESKFPIILPAKNQLTTLIIRYYHLKNLHIGPTGLLNCVRQKFWPINGRNLVRKIAHECVTCFKAKPTPSEQILGDLPFDRVNQNYVFNCTGIDFCGPFQIRYKNQRKGTYQKIYVCIFVCLVTRAIHLEIVSDLTSESFIATLKRFFSRRGKSAKLFSDNAKTFVGTHSELQKLHKMIKQPDEKIAGYLSSEEIQWKFIPPRSPNFGGLWEAGVKSFKYYLKRSVGDTKLTIEEFLTLINQIEGILNSRPLSPLSSDPEDLDVLTPAHFLIGRPINAIPELDLTLLPETKLSHWQRVIKLTQNIWKRWNNSFLSNLQQRTKWMFKKDNLSLGSLVLLKEDDMPICKWLIGRIIEIFPGKDGNIRVAKIKTKKGIFKRSIGKICVLPLEKAN